MISVMGPCTLSGDCIRSPGYPNDNYGADESCTATNLPAVPAIVVAFDVDVDVDVDVMLTVWGSPAAASSTTCSSMSRTSGIVPR